MKLVQYNLFFDILVFDIEYRVLTRISIMQILAKRVVQYLINISFWGYMLHNLGVFSLLVINI